MCLSLFLCMCICVHICIHISVWACNMYTYAYLRVHMHPNYQRRLLLGAPVPRGASTTALRKQTRVLAESLPQRSPSVHCHVRLVISNCPSAGGYMVLVSIRYILHSLHFQLSTPNPLSVRLQHKSMFLQSYRPYRHVQIVI